MKSCQLKSLQNEKKTIDKFTKKQLYYKSSLQNANDERRILKLFRNLEAEQARFGLTNQKMAEKLGISRVSYENKKKTGKFTACEAKILCQIFSVKFEYLFKTE